MSPETPEAFVRSRFGSGASTDAISGDASDRRYFRVRLEDGESRVLMLLREPFDPPYLPFARMAEFFAEQGFTVPRVLEHHPAQRILVIEDLGDVSLHQHLSGPPGDGALGRRPLYEEAVDLIVGLQRSGTPAVTPDVPAYHFCLDDAKLGRELDYFREHYVERLLGDPLTAAGRKTLQESLHAIAGRAGRSGDRVLCHRDFHSRNLMLRRETQGSKARLGVLDFQDARLGPRAYDLASLLCDAYVDVPVELARDMTVRFLQGVGREERPDEFAVDYAWVAAQRTLKAVGTFAGQANRFANEAYLQYVPRSLAHARAALGQLEGMSALRDLLTDPLDFRIR